MRRGVLWWDTMGSNSKSESLAYSILLTISLKVCSLHLNKFCLFFFYFQENASSLTLNERYFMSLLLEPRSLFLLTEDLYHNYLHGIAERTYDVVTDKVANLDACNNATLGDILQRNTRISLTIRKMPKILKFKINLGRWQKLFMSDCY